MREFFAGIASFIVGIFGAAEPTQPAIYSIDQPAAAIVATATSEATSSFLSQLPLFSCGTVSVVDCLKAQGLPSDVDFRAALMRELNLTEEPGTVAGNAALRDALNARALTATQNGSLSSQPNPASQQHQASQQNPSPNGASEHSTGASPRVATAGSNDQASPTVIREVLPPNVVTRAELDAALAALRTDVLAIIANSMPRAYSIASPAPVAPVSFTSFAHSQRIDKLANVTITNATFDGVSGLTDQDIPDTITASNYLPLSGGTLSGDLTLSGALTVPYITATSLTASTFLQASTTRFSIFDRLYVGGTATTTILGSATSTFGAGIETSFLNITGTAATSTFAQGIDLAGGCFAINGTCVGSGGGGSGTVGSGTTGQFPYYAAAGTTLTATSSIFLSTTGSVGIGTSTPTTKFTLSDVSGNVVAELGKYNWPDSTPGSYGVLTLTTYDDSGNSFWRGKRARGTASSPSAVQTDDYLTSFSGMGFDGTSFPSHSDAAIALFAEQNFTPTNHPAYISFQTTPANVAPTASTKQERMRIASNGNVGIGTTSPGKLLSVAGSGYFTGNVGIGVANPVRLTGTVLSINGTSQSSIELLNGGASAGEFFANSSNVILASWTTAPLVFRTNGTNERMRIDSSGNVGIGGASSGSLLSVAGSGYFAGNVGIGTTTANQLLALDNTSRASGYSLQISNFNGTGGGFWNIGQTDNSYAAGGGSLVFVPNTTASANATVVFKNSGNVGIGSTSPFAKLSVKGAGSTTGVNFQTTNSSDSPLFTILDSGKVGVATTSPWRTLSVTGTVGFDGLTGATGAGSLCLSANREVVYNSASDACLPSLRDTKHDINPLVVDALSQVLALQPVSFVYNEGDGRVRYGFIAEETASVDPHLTTYSASGTLSGIDDRSILAVVVKAIQDLAGKITDILARLSGHDAQIAALEARIAALEASQGASAAGSTTPTPEEGQPDTEAPTITILGNNPAIIQVGDAYSDLGATITDNVDSNLGYQVFLGATPWASAHLDTSEPNEWSIHYVATDNAGNTATSTRTVIVESPSIVPAPEQSEEIGEEQEEEAAPEEQ